MRQQFADIIVQVLEDEIRLDARAKSAWQSGLSALIAGISKSLK